MLPEHPPLGTPEFARWLNGRLTRFCGNGFHANRGQRGLVCNGTISTLGIDCPCLCECHAESQP